MPSQVLWRRILVVYNNTSKKSIDIFGNVHKFLLKPKSSLGLRTGIRHFGIKLSPAEATKILQENEFTQEVNVRSVKSFDSNQLPSNNPVEDARIEGKSLFTTGVIFGVFDGHGGPSCAQVVAKRLPSYVEAGMLPPEIIKEILDQAKGKPEEDYNLFQYFNDNFELVESLSLLYSHSFRTYLERLISTKSVEDFDMKKTLSQAFLALDENMLNEAKMDSTERPRIDSLHSMTMSVAISGAVGTIAHVDNEHLHVGSCGDCRVVLGAWDSEKETWYANVITQDHTAENRKEVARVLSEHPESEHHDIIRNDRLFGQLVPLRAFGDVRFKWSAEDVKTYITPLYSEYGAIAASKTPPYLTAAPETFHHRIKANEKFMILASDGLWDLLSPGQAVHLVGEHMFGKVTLKPFYLPDVEIIKLGDLHKTLSQRMNAAKLKPIDANSATHLIRHALAGTEHGYDHTRLSNLLTLPNDTVRLFRDDITATVVFFDSDYISTLPL